MPRHRLSPRLTAIIGARGRAFSSRLLRDRGGSKLAHMERRGRRPSRRRNVVPIRLCPPPRPRASSARSRADRSAGDVAGPGWTDQGRKTRRKSLRCNHGSHAVDDPSIGITGVRDPGRSELAVCPPSARGSRPSGSDGSAGFAAGPGRSAVDGAGVTPATGSGPAGAGRAGPRGSGFDRLTRQEERAGLLDDTATIGTQAGWADRLPERGYALRGHRLVRSRAGDGPAGTRSDDRSE
jgi:hypothetical protein